jgi:glucoamylase
LAFGAGRHDAVVTLLQSLGDPFAHRRQRFIEQWERACKNLLPIKKKVAGDGGRLYHASQSLLLAHEDKTYPGAMIASLSIPWGESRGDDDIGGYHLVWTRDMVNSATGLLAAGNTETPLRSLIYLACSQLPDGGFHQNFWINGDSYWTGIQLDEVAFPIMLAWRLHESNALRDFDPYPMVLRAAAYLVRQGPVNAGKRIAVIRRPRWRRTSRHSSAPRVSHGSAATATRPISSNSTRTFSNVMSRHGPSPPRGRWRPASLDTSSVYTQLRSAIRSRTKIRIRVRCPSATARRGNRISFQPKTSWMRVSWNWCVTVSADRAIR